MQPSTVPRPIVSLVRDPRNPGLIRCLFPYSPAAIAAIKDVPGRTYVPEEKTWRIPVNPENVLALKKRLGQIGWGLELGADLRDELNAAFAGVRAAAEVRKAGDSDIAFDYVTPPYAHQRAGLEFLAKLGSGALFWEMGLGKTKTAIDYAEWLNGQRPIAAIRREDVRLVDDGIRVLVICPNTVKRNWAAEIEKHAGHADYVVPTGTLAKRVTQLGAARYTIVNCEALSLNPLAAAIRDFGWDLVIVDESTRFKSPKAARTKTLHKMSTKTKRRVILTGTPITGKPEDAWAQLEFVAPGLFGKSFWAFTDRYLHKDWFGNVDGIKPEAADELRERIDSRSYRILKSQVLDLPPKVFSDRTVAIDGEQARAYRQMQEELRVEIAALGDEITANNILTMLLRLTQITAGLVGSKQTGYQWLGEQSAKVRELDALLNDELAGEQVVIFGLYQKELEELWKRYAPPSTGLDRFDQPAIIYGPTPEARRAELVELFQRGDLRRLFVQSRTGGIGITLTAAKTAIYHTRSWSLEEYLQSQDRLHRIGQTGTVSIIHLKAEGTIDEDIAKALDDKQALADDLTGDRVRKLAARILER
jgi:SNF2 family DNA or RNA helicase